MRAGVALVAMALIELTSCEDKSEGVVRVLDGGGIYRLHCQVCHGADGEGIPGRCPPFQGSPRFAAEDRREVLEIMLLGKRGDADHAGRAYQGLMPAWRNELGDSQVAAVLNFIQSMPRVEGGRPFDAAEVGAARNATSGKPHFP